MPKISDLTINVGVSISDETVARCCQLLAMYLSDNPNKTVYVSESRAYGTGERCVYVSIGEKEEDK